MSETTRTLTEGEMRQIEQWAHRARLAEMLSFFESLPRLFFLSRPVLLGSNNEWEILVEGFQAKDGGLRANGRDVTLADGRKLFVGSSGTGAPDERPQK